MHIFHKRQGQMDINQAYFYTETIQNFAHLLADDNLKLTIIESWQYLVQKKLIEVYAYVIMPNHIHLLWNILSANGKESPSGSFSKFTAHRFKKYLQQQNPDLLAQFVSDKRDRQFQFWKRDPLAVPITGEKIFMQKLEYIHNNPLSPRWNLCSCAEEYRWSSARFYYGGEDEFGVIKHFRD